MEENDEERREFIHKYYQIYRPLQKRHSLREHSHFDIYGNNFIEIWEYVGDRRGRCICKVKEDTETACYKRAIEQIEAKAWDYAKVCACNFCIGSHLHSCTGYDCREPYNKAYEYAMKHSNLL